MSLKDRFNQTNVQQTKKVETTERISPKLPEQTEKTSSFSIINTLLEDDGIASIYVNGAKNVFIERNKQLNRSTIAFKDDMQLENFIHKYGQLNNYKNEKYIKFVYKTGINAIATLPPLSDVATLYIKSYKEKFANFDNLEEQKTLSKEISLFIEALMKKNVNIIIAGDKKTFKTTLLQAVENNVRTVNRCINIDFSNEIQIKKTNFTNYDLADIENNKKIDEIIGNIFKTNPKKIFINDCPRENLNFIVQNALDDTKGICLNINAKSKEDALEKITFEILKNTPQINYEIAKTFAYKAFDFIIFVDDKEQRGILSVSEILQQGKDCLIQDIFLSNETKKHYSTGYAPDIFLEEENSSVNLNIFNDNYIHTYKEIAPKVSSFENKGLNPEFLKKFKKEVPKQEENKISKNIEVEQKPEEKQETTEPKQEIKKEVKKEDIASELVSIKQIQSNEEIRIVNEDEFMRKAQEKFDEIKKNFKNNL